MNMWLRWVTPALAAVTALLEAGHEGNLFSSEIIVLIFAILTAIGAFLAARSQPSEEEKLVQVMKKPEPPTAQPKK